MTSPSEATDSSQGMPTDSGPRLYGVVDVLRTDRIAGWAIDRTDSSAALDVEIQREGRKVAIVRADRPRADLVKTGVGTGRYGFACELDPPLEPGFEFTVAAVAHAADGASLELRRSGSRGGRGDPERRLVERLYEEVKAVRAAQEAPIESLLALVERLEITQARLEAAIGRVEPPEHVSGPNLVLWLAVAIAGVSLTLGMLSLVWS